MPAFASTPADARTAPWPAPSPWPLALRLHGPASGGRCAGRFASRGRRQPPSKVWHGRAGLAVYALALIGVNYRFGGNTPETRLDCSGLVRYVFQQVTGVTLPRTATRA